MRTPCHLFHISVSDPKMASELNIIRNQESHICHTEVKSHIPSIKAVLAGERFGNETFPTAIKDRQGHYNIIAALLSRCFPC